MLTNDGSVHYALSYVEPVVERHCEALVPRRRDRLGWLLAGFALGALAVVTLVTLLGVVW